MLFNSVKYGVFLVVVFLLFWAVVRVRLARMILLLAASYFFYANWNPTFLLLIWFSSSLDFFVGGTMGLTDRPWLRKLLLGVSICTNLGILAIFKYADFFLESASAAVVWMGMDPIRLRLDLILPVGISFYTFQTMSYIIDVYRRKLTPTYLYHEYLVYVSFFPQLVAGPIVRAVDLLPQFDKKPKLTPTRGSMAMWLIMGGLLKKVVIADYLDIALIDLVFSDPVRYTSLEALAAIYAYALQIYCDFSGYSDVAIGSALLMGYQIPINFDAPYTARNLRDFWRRWHISLSFWFRDYLYIPLGGNRHGAVRTYFNLWATMMLCGLWHGAEWRFIFWGFLHGCGVTATRIWQHWSGRDRAVTWWGRALTIILTFHFVCFAWVFFRADSIGTAWQILGLVFAGVGHAPNLTLPLLGLMLVGYALHWVPQHWEEAVRARFDAVPAPVQALVLFVVVVVLYSVASTDGKPYIYYQF
ncbi:MAG: MBOAT family protein [Candidatus Lernaella stagnicola]|nr:MBOAT family protein [Candidatus Lernaella stagnicola]